MFLQDLVMYIKKENITPVKVFYYLDTLPVHVTKVKKDIANIVPISLHDQ